MDHPAHTNTELPTRASSHPQPQQTTKTPSQVLLQEARAKLKLEHSEETRAVIDPSEPKPPRLTARQRAKYPKLTPAEDILTTVRESRWASLSSSEQYLRQPYRFFVEPFYTQLEEIDRVRAQFNLLARCSHAQVDSQARR